MKIYKINTAAPYCFIVNDTTFPSNDPLRFRKNLLKEIYNKIMTIDDQIKDEKIQHDINRKAAKISALSSGKIGKCEYLTGQEILPSNQKQIIGKDKFSYFPLGKAFKEQTKEQVKAIKDLNISDKINELKKYISTKCIK